jgi:hypothetical protein
MKRNPKSPKASTASSADNITLDVPTPLFRVKQMETVMEENSIKMVLMVLSMK